MNVLHDFFEGDTSRTGVSFVKGKGQEVYLSYSDLQDRSLAYLAVLQARGIEQGHELVFQIEDDQVFVIVFWACIFGGIVPVPVSIGNNEEHIQKLFKIWKLLKHPSLITNEGVMARIETFAREADLVFDLDGLRARSLDYEAVVADDRRGRVFPALPGDLAFIQFSSGSTGEPKGVMLTHGNLVANTGALEERLLWENDSLLSWMPLTHDMGLIALHMSFLRSHKNQFLMTPALFIRNPLLWLEKIAEHRITFTASPNFGYSFLLGRLEDGRTELPSVDLSSLRVILNGAEPISFDLCQAFYRKLACNGLSRNPITPGYGLAEGTVCVTAQENLVDLIRHTLDRNFLSVGQRVVRTDPQSRDALDFVEAGPAVRDVEVRIVDNQGCVVGDEVVGNIEIRGTSSTQGYYQNSTATEKLVTPDGWLRTGDLGFLRQGRLTPTGRAKDIIFVHGQNYYPHDVERVAAELDGIEINKVVACGVTDPSLRREVLLVCVLYRKSDLAEFLPKALQLRAHLRAKMGLEVDHVLPISKVYKTTSGKLQRYQMAQMYTSGEFNDKIAELSHLMLFGSNPVSEPALPPAEAKLLEVFRAASGRHGIGINTPLASMSIDSLTFIRLSESVRETFGVPLSASVFSRCPDLRCLAEVIAAEAAMLPTPKLPAVVADPGNLFEPFPLTNIQMAYWMGRAATFEIGNVSSHAYFEFETDREIPRLNRAIQRVVAAQPMLRCLVDEGGGQRFLPAVPAYEIAVEDLTSLDPRGQEVRIAAERGRLSHASFDLGRWPLFEFRALRVDDRRHRLLFHFDMIVMDGSSALLFLSEIAKFYEDPDRPEATPEFTFRDYALAYQAEKTSSLYKRDKAFWATKVEGFPGAPTLPLLVDPGTVREPRFQRLQRSVDRRLWSELRNRAQAVGVSPSCLLCTAYAYVLAFWGNLPRFALNLTVFNRLPFHEAVDRMIGDFTSILLLEIELDPEAPFFDNAKNLQQTILESLEHRRYDGIELLRDLSPSHGASTKAVMPYVFTGMVFSDDAVASSRLDQLGEVKFGISQTPQVFLDFQALETNHELSLTWDYVEQLFDEDMINGMFDQYSMVLEDLVGEGVQ